MLKTFLSRVRPRAAFGLALALAVVGILLCSGASLNSAFNDRRTEQECAKIWSAPLSAESNSTGVVNAELLRSFPLGIRCTFERADGTQFEVLRYDESFNRMFLAGIIAMAVALVSFVVGGISSAVRTTAKPTQLVANAN